MALIWEPAPPIPVGAASDVWMVTLGGPEDDASNLGFWCITVVGLCCCKEGLWGSEDLFKLGDNIGILDAVAGLDRLSPEEFRVRCPRLSPI